MNVGAMMSDPGWPLMGDREWVAACLRERLRRPELYERREDVAATIAKLRRQLAAFDSDDVQKETRST